MVYRKNIFCKNHQTFGNLPFITHPQLERNLFYIGRGSYVTMIKIMLAFWTPCKYSIFKGYKEYWDFPNMVESIKSSKKSPKNFLTPIFARKYKGFRNFHKDALGREKKSSKIDVFCVHSTKITSHKPLFYGKFYVVVKWSYEGESGDSASTLTAYTTCGI